MPFPTQFTAVVTTIGSEKPSALLPVFSSHGSHSSSSRLDSTTLEEMENESSNRTKYYTSQTSVSETQPECYTGTGNLPVALWPAVSMATAMLRSLQHVTREGGASAVQSHYHGASTGLIIHH